MGASHTCWIATSRRPRSTSRSNIVATAPSRMRLAAQPQQNRWGGTPDGIRTRATAIEQSAACQHAQASRGWGCRRGTPDGIRTRATALRGRPKSRRTALEINEPAGQGHNARSAVVGRFWRFLDVVLPQCCPNRPQGSRRRRRGRTGDRRCDWPRGARRERKCVMLVERVRAKRADATATARARGSRQVQVDPPSLRSRVIAAQLAARSRSASVRRAAAAARWPRTDAEQGDQYGVAASSSSASGPACEPGRTAPAAGCWSSR